MMDFDLEEAQGIIRDIATGKTEMAIAVNANASPKRFRNYLKAVAKKFKFTGLGSGRVKGSRNAYVEYMQGTRKPLNGLYVYLIVDYSKSQNSRGFITHYSLNEKPDAPVIVSNGGFSFENGSSFQEIPKDFVKFEQVMALILGVGAKMTSDGDSNEVQTPGAVKDKLVFDINKRFQMMSQMIRMVVQGGVSGMIITGQGGLGKTHSVTTTLEALGLVENEDYFSYSGKITPLALWDIFIETDGKIAIFDDCDSVLQDGTSLEFFKAGLDTYKVRTITYKSPANRSGVDQIDYTGKIIFISNLTPSGLNQALRSRSVQVDVTMTRDQILDRMTNILPHLEKDVPMEMRQEAYEHLVDFVKNSDDRPHDFNIRTLIKIIKFRASDSGEGEWRDMSTYMLSTS